MMVSRQRSGEEANATIPTEIGWGGRSAGAGGVGPGSSIDLDGSFTYCGAQSCVSSVTRELPDLDAPTLYPSIESVTEVADLEVNANSVGNFQVFSAGLDHRATGGRHLSYGITSRSRREESWNSQLTSSHHHLLHHNATDAHLEQQQHPQHSQLPVCKDVQPKPPMKRQSTDGEDSSSREDQHHHHHLKAANNTCSSGSESHKSHGCHFKNGSISTITNSSGSDNHNNSRSHSHISSLGSSSFSSSNYNKSTDTSRDSLQHTGLSQIQEQPQEREGPERELVGNNAVVSHNDPEDTPIRRSSTPEQPHAEEETEQYLDPGITVGTSSKKTSNTDQQGSNVQQLDDMLNTLRLGFPDHPSSAVAGKYAAEKDLTHNSSVDKQLELRCKGRRSPRNSGKSLEEKDDFLKDSDEKHKPRRKSAKLKDDNDYNYSDDDGNNGRKGRRSPRNSAKLLDDDMKEDADKSNSRRNSKRLSAKEFDGGGVKSETQSRGKGSRSPRNSALQVDYEVVERATIHGVASSMHLGDDNEVNKAAKRRSSITLPRMPLRCASVSSVRDSDDEDDGNTFADPTMKDTSNVTGPRFPVRTRDSQSVSESAADGTSTDRKLPEQQNKSPRLPMRAASVCSGSDSQTESKAKESNRAAEAPKSEEDNEDVTKSVSERKQLLNDAAPAPPRRRLSARSLALRMAQEQVREEEEYDEFDQNTPLAIKGGFLMVREKDNNEDSTVISDLTSSVHYSQFPSSSSQGYPSHQHHHRHRDAAYLPPRDNFVPEPPQSHHDPYQYPRDGHASEPYPYRHPHQLGQPSATPAGHPPTRYHDQYRGYDQHQSYDQSNQYRAPDQAYYQQDYRYAQQQQQRPYGSDPYRDASADYYNRQSFSYSNPVPNPTGGYDPYSNHNQNTSHSTSQHDTMNSWAYGSNHHGQNLSQAYTSSHSRASSGNSSSQRTLELEIQPGVFLRLRDSTETVMAMRNEFVEHVTCLACETSLICIADAEYVLCPVCKVVGPIDSRPGGVGGVGLGVQLEDAFA